jgi:crotonyl-CoA carboxylase/reductase
MAAGINYNNVWAALGRPVDVIANRQKQDKSEPPFHVGGSDASGIVWAVGEGARGVKIGDEVVLSCASWDEDAADIRAGADPITSSSARIWGYEGNWGSFAQFTLVDDYQCHPKPPKLSWEAAAAYMLVGATAYRQLMGWEPHVVRPGDPVLIWGGSGGLGSMAIQIVKAKGGIPIAVVSSKERIEHCLRLGAHGVIDRTDPAFTHWGRLPDTADTAAYAQWMQGANAFRKKWSEVLGSRQGPRIVLEHPGESTVPTSILVCDNAGMVVICAGTTGYNADVDLRYLWMRQKRLQGSHFANTEQSSPTGPSCHEVFGGVLGAGMALLSGVLSVFTVLVLTLYFLASLPTIKAAAYAMVPASRRGRVVVLSEEITAGGSGPTRSARSRWRRSTPAAPTS